MIRWGHLLIRPAVSNLWLLHVDHRDLNFCPHLPLALLLYFFFSQGRTSTGFRIMTHRVTSLPHFSPLFTLKAMSHWWVILFYYPATTWKVTATTPETSFFTPFFFPAPHFFTDRVKLCSTNCLNIIFSVMGGGGGWWGDARVNWKKKFLEMYLTQW